MEAKMDTINIMINGLPGNVAATIAMAALKDDRFHVLPVSLTGPEIDAKTFQVDHTGFTLIQPDEREEKIKEIQSQFQSFTAIDFTHPTAVNTNAVFYSEHRIPFVMGTTGGDREALEQTVKQAALPAVIAPNMAKQIVGFQAMMADAAKNFPGLFNGYTLKVVESHQQGKADTSGTAKAMVGYFNDLGPDFKVDDIEMIRDPGTQQNELNIPPEHLGGHGWHTYTLTSKDNSVLFEFTHNINGREIYVEGTLDAVLFLNEQQQKTESGKKLYTMIDVLKNG